MDEMYDNPDHIEDTFTETNLSPYLLQSQWAEFIELKKAFSEIIEKFQKKISVLDIGIGDARIIENLEPIKEIWNQIDSYTGIDIAQNCIDISNEVIKNKNLEKICTTKLVDAQKIQTLNRKFDIIISTWFTVGNFYPENFDPKNFQPGTIDLNKNEKFSEIFKQAYSQLNDGGEIIIGSAYIDSESARKKQEDSYKNFGWEVISNELDSFTASSEGWFSQRFSKQRIYDYLPFVPKEKISFISLDTYEYAMMIRIKK